MIKVTQRPLETTQQMVNRFKRACTQEGLVKQIKRVSHYQKPSEKRRQKLAQSKQRRARMAQNNKPREW